MSMNSEPTHRGTLVCVVLKAKNLPNKKSIGKQDPYCTLQLGTHSQKTKPDKRGGQHPSWDEQLHFEIYDDMEDQLRNTAEGTGSIGASSSIETQKKSKSKTSKSLRVTCYADDAKEPEFIGEGVVDLADTLKSGEFDEWVTIKAKERYAGEVYLELTFYSSAAPPKKQKTSKPVVAGNTTYGGAGTFSEDIDEYEFAPKPVIKESSHAPIPSYMRPGSQQPSRLSNPSGPNNSSGMTSSKSHAQLGSLPPVESVPSSLRPSSSLAQLDSYTPPYAPPKIHREKSPAPSEFAQPRRESFPPPNQSASSQFYGHRLPDAAPASMVSQHFQDQSRYGHSLSSSISQQQIPPSTSVSTLRGNQIQHEGYDAAIDDLSRPLSSMSMGTRPSMAELPAPNIESHQQPQYPASYQPQHQTYAPPPPPPSSAPPTGAVDQFGRPAQPPSLHSYAQGSTQSNAQFPAPTPPPPSHSAPPGVYQAQGAAHWTTPPPHQASLPSSASQFIAPPPNMQTARPTSAGGYHALPQPPPQQQQQQYLSEHAGASQGSSYLSRPLPSTTPMQSVGSIGTPPSSFAPPPPSTSNFYPPPPQTSSHYVSPPPMMQWNNGQPPPPNSEYSSYPPPPPGPINGGYVHATPQQASPSSHPGQYPPPPPMHQAEYSQQYYHQQPPPQHQQQAPLHPAQQPPPPFAHPPQPSTQSYYHPQQPHQPPY